MASTREQLMQQFDQVVRKSCEDSKRLCRYDPHIIRRMVSEWGAYETASRLLLKDSEVQRGFTEMWLCETEKPYTRALDLTLEATVLRPEFDDLFDDDTGRDMRAVARKRLEAHGYPRFP